MEKEKIVIKEDKEEKEPSDGGSKKKIIVAVVVVVVIVAIIGVFLLTRDEGNGNGNNGGNQPPTAEFTYLPEEVYTNQTVNFEASDSTDPDGDELEYSWDFGDPNPPPGYPNTASGLEVVHRYATPGNYSVTLMVDDGKEDGTDEKIKNVTVIEEVPPTVSVITAKTQPAYESLTNIRWTITVDDVEGTNDQLSLSNIRYNIYNGSDTSDAKLTGEVTQNPPSFVSSNDDGIYFDDIDGNSRISQGDTFYIAGDGGASIEVGDNFQLLYKPPYFEEGVPMCDPEPLPP